MIVMLASAMTLHAQHGGNSDIVASPWWVGVGVGMNTWVGNEAEAEGCWNLDRPSGYLDVEVGRWMSPEWSLSFRMSAFGVHGQTRNLLHPMVDFASQPMTVGQYPYQPFYAFGLSAMATVTMDWTNLDGVLPGGLHFYSPLSLGAVILMGSQKNPVDAEHALGETRTRGSLAFSTAAGLRYGIDRENRIELFGEAGFTLVGSSIDWSPEDAGGLDLMPSFTVGVRMALPSRRERPHYSTSRHSQRDRKSQEEPQGLVDDMMFTNEQQHLPVAVVRFAYDDNQLDDNAMRQLNLFMSQMESSDWFTEFYIIGTADDARASESHNRRLCKRRCQAVYDALVNTLEVDEYRLLLLPDGGYSEYEHQQGERMVLIIQRTPETEEVVERWISNY